MTEESTTAAVELRAIRRHYGIVRALDGIDLEVRAGEQLAVVGPSGCGKSTLLAVIGALERPTDGAARVLGVDVAALADEERARFRRDRIGFVFQSYDLLPFLTAYENVAVQSGIARRGRLDGARQLLADLGLAGLEDRFPDELSGGQQQRVALARSLVHRPGVVLADEPTGGLDSATSAHVVTALCQAAAAVGAALIVVTHDHAVASRFARRVTLRDGRVADDVTAVAGA